MQRLRTGIPGFDEVIQGGLISDRIYLVDGDPGAGKTTFALQFLLEGVRNGERCLYVTLSETRDELVSGARSHGWSLDGLEIFELLADAQDLDGESDLTMLNPSEVELGETTRKVLEVVERTKPSRMVFDSLSEMRLLAQNSLRYRRQILALKQFFVGRACTVVLLDDRMRKVPTCSFTASPTGSSRWSSSRLLTANCVVNCEIIKYRGSDFASGFHDFVIRTGGYPGVPATGGVGSHDGLQTRLIPSGVTTLDALLGGGIERGTSTLLMGPPGCGKSTIAMQYAAAAAERGDHAVAFALTKPRGVAGTLDGLGLRIVEGTGAGQIMIRQIDPVEISPGEFAHVVRASVEEQQGTSRHYRQPEWLPERHATQQLPHRATARAVVVSEQSWCRDVHRGRAKRHDGQQHDITGGCELSR